MSGFWVLEKTIGGDWPGRQHYPYGVAVNPANGDIIAAASDSIPLYSAEGQRELFLDITKDPWDVTASCDGNFCFVTFCTRYIRWYDVNGLYKGQWVAISPQGRPSDTENTDLRGLTADANDQVLMGEVNTKYISKHRYDGSHVASFKVDIAPLSLVVTSEGAIIISDWGRSNSVHIVDNVGHLLHVIKPPADIQDWGPRGIACYDDIICIYNETSKSICCFPLSGEYLGSIRVDIPGYPICLTFTTDGKKLLVTHWFSSGLSVYRLQV